MLCLRLLSLHNALRRTALQHGCEILSGVSCKRVYPVLGDDGQKRSALILAHAGGGEGEEEEEEEEVVMADFVVGADGLKSVVRAIIGGACAASLWVHLLLRLCSRLPYIVDSLDTPRVF